MTSEFAFLLAPEYAQNQDKYPSSDLKDVSVDQMKSLINAEASHWGDGTIGGRLYYARESDGLALPSAPELTIHFREGNGFQFFLGGRENHGNSSIALNPPDREGIFSVQLDCQTPYFVPSNAFFSRENAIRIVEEYFLFRGDISKSEYRWLTVSEKDADFDNPEYWVEQARKRV